MLHFYNSLTRRREEFVPLESGRANVYVCGPTIYAPPHIGNLRTFFFADILHRYLEFRGYDVKFVMNLTDVDDKTIAGAHREGVSLREYTEPFARTLFANFDVLGIARADVYPRATEHVPQMIELIGRLVDRGLAYQADGSVYYDISEFPEYGKLSHADFSGSHHASAHSFAVEQGAIRPPLSLPPGGPSSPLGRATVLAGFPVPSGRQARRHRRGGGGRGCSGVRAGCRPRALAGHGAQT